MEDWGLSREGGRRGGRWGGIALGQALEEMRKGNYTSAPLPFSLKRCPLAMLRRDRRPAKAGVGQLPPGMPGVQLHCLCQRDPGRTPELPPKGLLHDSTTKIEMSAMGGGGVGDIGVWPPALVSPIPRAPVTTGPGC